MSQRSIVAETANRLATSRCELIELVLAEWARGDKHTLSEATIRWFTRRSPHKLHQIEKALGADAARLMGTSKEALR